MKADDAFNLAAFIDPEYTGREGDEVTTIQHLCSLYALTGLEGIDDVERRGELFGCLQRAVQGTEGMGIRETPYDSKRSSFAWVMEKDRSV